MMPIFPADSGEKSARVPFAFARGVFSPSKRSPSIARGKLLAQTGYFRGSPIMAIRKESSQVCYVYMARRAGFIDCGNPAVFRKLRP